MSRMISVDSCQAVLPLLPHTHTHTGLTPQDGMSGKDLRTHFRLGWAIERPSGPLGCWSLPTLRQPLLLLRRSTASSRWGQADRGEPILGWHSRKTQFLFVCHYPWTVGLYDNLIQRLWLWQLLFTWWILKRWCWAFWGSCCVELQLYPQWSEQNTRCDTKKSWMWSI